MSTMRAPEQICTGGANMPGNDRNVVRHSVVDHILAVAFAVLLYFVVPPAAAVFLSILILAGFVVSLAVPRW